MQPYYPVTELIERLKEEHAKLGNHPNVFVQFSRTAEDFHTRVPNNNLPSIVIPIPVYE